VDSLRSTGPPTDREGGRSVDVAPAGWGGPAGAATAGATVAVIAATP